jgi:hypothetical protein
VGWLLLSIARRPKDGTQDWKELGTRFRMTVADDAEITQSFVCFGTQTRDSFPLDRQWISPTSKFVNQINRELQQW